MRSSNATAEVFRAHCRCCVLNDRQLVTSGHGKNRVQIGGQAHLMDWHDRPGLRSDGLLDRIGIDVVGVRVDVNEYRGSSPVNDGICGGAKGKTGANYLVTRLERQGGHDQM